MRPPRPVGPRVLLAVFALLWLTPADLLGQAQPECPLCVAAQGLVERFGLRESEEPVSARPDWAPPTKVVTLFGPGFADLLRQLAPEAEIIGVTDTTRVAEVISGAQVYIGMCTPGIIEAGQDLRYIHINRAGAETCAGIPEVAERDILVTNMQRVLGTQIADHAMALLLSLTREMPLFAREQGGGGFSRGPSQLRGLRLWELEGKTMLIVGLGGIGVEIARRAHAFGMRVTATRNSSREGPEFVDYVGLADEVLELAGEADVVMNSTPLTPSTSGMFDAEFFDAMKNGALFVSVGRGESAVTDDLVAALESGKLGGAALDVTDPEPLPPGHPLWAMPNVVLTPHVAGGSDVNRLKFGGLAAENFRRYVAGERVLNVVRLRRGY